MAKDLKVNSVKESSKKAPISKLVHNPVIIIIHKCLYSNNNKEHTTPKEDMYKTANLIKVLKQMLVINSEIFYLQK